MPKTTESKSIYINRELSWLDFNSRVLYEAKDKNIPLGERLKFASIYGSNLDEFFMIRVGSLYDQTLLKNSKPDNVTGMTAEAQLTAVAARVSQLQNRCDKYYAPLLQALQERGYRKVDFDRLSNKQERFWKTYFRREIQPILSPQIIDSRHPFPFLNNKQIYFIVQLYSKIDGSHFGIIPISPSFERVLYVNSDEKDDRGPCVYFAFVEELIAHFAAAVFTKHNVQKVCLFRVTRNADITVDEGLLDHDIDFREAMSELVKKRRKLAAVRLQFWKEVSPETVRFLRENLKVPAQRCFVQSTPLDMDCLSKLAAHLSEEKNSNLFYTPARPLQAPARFHLYEEAQRRDLLIAYPYQSMRPFIRLLLRAGVDPDVIAIKMTLYRIASESQIVQALINAAENGKQVVVVVELRARFDEQNNIDWSKQLEEAGCTVFYGFEDYKVHSKLTVITSKKDGKYSYLTQIGTGNYNEKTSEQYSDLSFVTTRKEIGEEANAVFNSIATHRLPDEIGQKLLVAPLHFRSVLLQEMDALIARAAQGQPAAMILKNNSINDPQLIEKISDASCAGVRIDMIVRGICCIRAGVPGKTENVHIRSIVGRYLEHARVYCFDYGNDTHMYIASGDFLTRNTERRIEVGVRIEDKRIVGQLRDILDRQLRDTVNAFEMQPNGNYTKVKNATDSVDSQMEMYEYFKDGWEVTLPVAAKTTAKGTETAFPIKKTIPRKKKVSASEQNAVRHGVPKKPAQDKSHQRPAWLNALLAARSPLRNKKRSESR